ncbi:MAG: hypothetical protein P8Y53_05780, partial [Pseudolabrys sp.]
MRHVCAFGDGLPDGVVPLDDLFADAAPLPAQAASRSGSAAAHVALISFEPAAAGPVALARSHLQLMAGGTNVFQQTDLARQASILSAIPPASFAGVALTLLPWLLSGGTLALHHGGDPDVLAAQCEGLSDATVILPGPALAPPVRGRPLKRRHQDDCRAVARAGAARDRATLARRGRAGGRGELRRDRSPGRPLR